MRSDALCDGQESPETPRRFRDTFCRLKAESSRYRAAGSAGEFFSRLVRLVTPGVVAVLTAVFLSKLLWPPLFWAVWVLPLAVLAVSVYLVFKQRSWLIPAWRARAFADLESGNRGLYMALDEARGEDWRQNLVGENARLRAHFPSRAAATACALSVAFTVLVHLPDLRPPGKARGGPATPLQKLAELVDVLEVEKLAQPEYLESAKQLLQELKEKETEALGSEDWQAVDKCQEELKRQVAESYRNLEESLAEMEAIASRLGQGQALRDADSRELAGIMSKLSAKDLKEISDKVLKGKFLSEKELSELLKKCRAGKCEFSDAELRALNLLLGECKKKMGSCSGKGKECLMGMGFSEEELESLAGQPGRGGITRGPGPAPLAHSGATDPQVGEFQPETFRGSEAEPTVNLGYLAAPPEEPESAPSPLPGGRTEREFKRGDERVTWHSRLLPRHEDVVKRYFSPTEGE